MEKPPTFKDVDAHFDRAAGKWKYEDEQTGEEFEYDGQKWTKVLTDELVKSQQAAYAVAGIDESATVTAKDLKRKRKEEKPAKEPKTKQPKRKSTRIRITNLPQSITLSDLLSVFSKAGLILEDAEGNPRAKLYYDSDGAFTGEASIIYLQEESVQLAITLFDGTPFDIGGSENMSVTELVYENSAAPTASATASTSATPADAPRSTAKSTSNHISKQRQKLTDWSSDDERRPRKPKPSTTVILKHMFTLAELDEDPTLLLDLKEDVREECEALGEVTNITLYDAEPLGIISVRFKDLVSAQACIIKMNGRFFAGRKVEAILHDGKTKYKKSSDRSELDRVAQIGQEHDVDDPREKERLDKYAKWLETDGSK